MGSIYKSRMAYEQLQLAMFAMTHLYIMEELALEKTEWIREAVIDFIIDKMGYPKSDFVIETLLDCLNENKPFDTARAIIEDWDDEVVISGATGVFYDEGDE